MFRVTLDQLEGKNLNCVFQNTILGLEGQTSRNFREREAFIVIYDVTSKIQVSKLSQWYAKI